MINTYNNPIEIEISSLYGFDRKATYRTLIADSKNKIVSILLDISWWKDGEQCIDESRNLKPYQKEIKATNDVLINQLDPSISIKVIDFQNEWVNEDGTWKEDTPRYYMGEADFYAYLRDNANIKLKDLILGAMIKASKKGIL